MAHGFTRPFLSTTGVTAASYGSAASVATFTVDLFGRITTAANVAIAVDASAISTGQLSITHGGTGAATASAAFSALSPMTTTGDIIYSSSGTTATRLPIGANGRVLSVVSGLPAWVVASSGVSSVGLSLPAMFSVSGSPVTTSGTLTATLATQAAHIALIGPSSGSAAAPTFRQLDYTDVATPLKLPCRVVATTNTNIAAPGTTIDGITMAANDRVLLTAQTTTSQNGIWIWNSSGGALTRPEDYANGNGVEAFADMEVKIRSGTAGAGTSWRLTTTGAIIIDSTNTAWSQVGPVPVSAGGTGVATISAGLLPFGNGTSALSTNAALAWDTTHSWVALSSSSISTRVFIGGVTSRPPLMIGFASSFGNYGFYGCNVDGGANTRITADYAQAMAMVSQNWYFNYANTSTAGSSITWKTAFFIDCGNDVLEFDIPTLFTGAGPSFGALTTIAENASTSGSRTAFLLTGGAHTTLSAGTESIDVNFNLARTVQWATGALNTQRAFLVQAPTYSFVGASTLTAAATFVINGSPIAGTNATFISSYALWVQSGVSRLDGNVSLFAAGNFGGGSLVMFISNAFGIPTSNPTGGGLLYVSSGALVWRGSSGTITTIAPA